MNSRNRNFLWVPLIFLALDSVLNAQQSASSGSNVPALPADIPGSAMRYSALIMGNLSVSRRYGLPRTGSWGF
jgi:hypothetical protein